MPTTNSVNLCFLWQAVDDPMERLPVAWMFSRSSSPFGCRSFVFFSRLEGCMRLLRKQLKEHTKQGVTEDQATFWRPNTKTCRFLIVKVARVAEKGHLLVWKHLFEELLSLGSVLSWFPSKLAARNHRLHTLALAADQKPISGVRKPMTDPWDERPMDRSSDLLTKVFALLWACYCLRQARACWGSDPDGTWGIFLERLQVILVTWWFNKRVGKGMVKGRSLEQRYLWCKLGWAMCNFMNLNIYFLLQLDCYMFCHHWYYVNHSAIVELCDQIRLGSAWNTDCHDVPSVPGRYSRLVVPRFINRNLEGSLYEAGERRHPNESLPAWCPSASGVKWVSGPWRRVSLKRFREETLVRTYRLQ